MIRKTATLVSATLLLMAVSNDNILKVHSSDYNIELSIDTIEVPVNYVESDRRFCVPVRVINNPGIESLNFIVERDSRITANICPLRYNDYPFGTELGAVNILDSITGVYGGYMINDYYYDTDGVFCALEIYLPDHYEVGDFFTISFSSDSYDRLEDTSFFKDGTEYGIENFSFVNGGIRITEAKERDFMPYETTVTQEQIKPADSASAPSVQGNEEEQNRNEEPDRHIQEENSNEQKSPSEDKVSVTVPASSAVSVTSSVTTAVKNDNVTTVTGQITSVSEITSVEQIVSESSMSETNVPENDEVINEINTENNGETVVKRKSYGKAAACIGGLALLAAFILALLFKKKKDK